MSEMLEIQKYFINSTEANLEAKLEKLKEELGIKSKLYPEDGLVILNYSQIESPKSHPIVIECRSLILNMNTYGVVSRKFDRFFNHGECPDFYSDFDITRAYTFTKEDGSLIGVYYNNFTSKWEISTRSLAKAEGEHASGGTFREKVLSAFGFDSEDHFQNFSKNKLDNTYTYIFEYCGPSNRVVFRYEKEEMVLTGVRNNTTGDYLTYNLVEYGAITFQGNGLSVRVVESFPLHTIEEIKAAIEALPSLEEGYVCFDPVSGKRVKIKSFLYLKAHRMRGENTISKKQFYELVLSNEHDEFLVYFPEFNNFISPIISDVNSAKEEMDILWGDVKHINDQKEFALSVKWSKYSPILFMSKKTNSIPSKIFDGIELSKKLKYFI